MVFAMGCGDPVEANPYSGGGEPVVAIWEWCPLASAYQGDESWEGLLEVTAGALYCGAPLEHRSLDQEAKAKAQLRVLEGSYPLPTTDGDYEILIPACMAVGSMTGAVELGDPGIIGASSYDYADTSYVFLTLDQPMEGTSGKTWTMDFDLRLEGPQGKALQPLVLDGREFERGSYAGTRLQALIEDDSEGVSPQFGPCVPESWELHEHALEFEGGNLQLQLRIAMSMDSTEPSSFVYAYGELDGSSFTQDNYWKLTYTPEHHHYIRHFAVLFEHPIGDAHGLRVDNLDPYQLVDELTVQTVDSDLVPLEQLDVLSQL